MPAEGYDDGRCPKCLNFRTYVEMIGKWCFKRCPSITCGYIKPLFNGEIQEDDFNHLRRIILQMEEDK